MVNRSVDLVPIRRIEAMISMATARTEAFRTVPELGH